MRYIIALLALVLLAASAPSPDISSTWQGTITVPGIGTLPRVMRITKAGSRYNVRIYSTQASEVPIATSDVGGIHSDRQCVHDKADRGVQERPTQGSSHRHTPCRPLRLHLE